MIKMDDRNPIHFFGEVLLKKDSEIDNKMQNSTKNNNNTEKQSLQRYKENYDLL